VLHFKAAPAAATPTLRWGENLHKWKVRFTASERCDEVLVRGWDGPAKREIEARATAPDAWGSAAAGPELAAAARRAHGPVVRSAGHLGVTSRQEADELAASLARRAAENTALVRGEAVGDPHLAAGDEIEVEGVGRRLSGSYVVTAVEHVYGPGTPYVTRFVCGGREPAALPDLLGGSAREEPDRAALVTGVVTNVDDEEHLGRVKVRLPTVAPEDESTWARVLAPGAGAQRGVQWLPEVGDEVVVGFEHGDLRRPFVLGGLWNREDRPPAEAVEGGRVTVRGMTTREGHRLELRDGGQAGATLEAPEIEIIAGRRLRLQAPRIEIAADGECTLTGTPIRLN
jgi:phage baseplate assembly protein V